jgi:hypothetical protein
MGYYKSYKNVYQQIYINLQHIYGFKRHLTQTNNTLTPFINGYSMSFQ